MSKGLVVRVVFLTLVVMALREALVASGDGRTPPPAPYGSNQTVPTRTPTPGPASPTPPPPTSPPGATAPPGSSPTAAASPPPAVSPTTAPPTALVTVFPTLTGGYLPTAEPCGPPTVQAIDLVYVRSGPGPDYPIIGGLAYLEVRLIVGRGQSAAWWRIQLADGTLGWVANSVVNVHGYTGHLPIVEAPPLDGRPPTPGPAWNPTPNPACPATWIPIASIEATPPATTQFVTVATVIMVSPAAATATLVSQPSVTPIVPPQATAVSNPTAVTPIEVVTTPAAGGSNWLLYGGLAFVLAAGVAAVLHGRKRPSN